MHMGCYAQWLRKGTEAVCGGVPAVGVLLASAAGPGRPV